MRWSEFKKQVEAAMLSNAKARLARGEDPGVSDPEIDYIDISMSDSLDVQFTCSDGALMVLDA
jgi:hypothetical protein